MNDTVVLAHMGEEALPVLLPLVLVALFVYLAARRRPRDDDEDTDRRS